MNEALPVRQLFHSFGRKNFIELIKYKSEFCFLVGAFVIRI